jgi:hypothetical protein
MTGNSRRTDPAALADEIQAAFRERRPPAFGEWNVARHHLAAAIDAVCAGGNLEAAEHAVRHLYSMSPGSRYARNLCAVFDRMPPAGRQLPFADDLTKEVQIVPRKDAETVALLFCGDAQRLGIPLSAIHRWLGLISASLVYLRDFRRLSYITGLPSLGPDREATLASLCGIISSLGGRRTVCYGNSAGAFAALHYGLDLGSETVLSLSGFTNLSAEFNAHLRQAVNIGRLRRELPNGLIDLRRLYGTAHRPPRALLLYAQHNWDDRLHAEYLSGLPTVSLKAVENNDEHNVVVELIKRGEFAGLLDWLVRV